MYMQFNMKLPGLESVIVTKMEELEGNFHLHVKLPVKKHCCPACGENTSRIHDYRIQKVQHLKIFERTAYLFYKKRRYVCSCGKRFPEKNHVVERYQRHSIEWNQALGLRVIQGKNFKDTAGQFRTSQATAIRRFDHLGATRLKEVDTLPSVIAIDEYKGDTTEGKYQVIVADGKTGVPLDILPNRSVRTVKKYLAKKGSQVKMVVMDMSHSFKAAVKKALGNPIIIADRFHFCRYIYWALERVRRRVQKEFHDYDRKKCKRMKHIFYKRYEELTDKQHWYLERYLGLSEDLRTAYGLKEAYRSWFDEAKNGTKDLGEIKQGLYRFYNQVEKSGMDEFIKAIGTLKNWQPEVLNSFAFGYTNGFVEGLNNQTKVIKRNAFGFKRYDRLRLRVLLHHQFKDLDFRVG
ncbi:ISL3 family transposase [Paraliobacillus ryukyuensis]|uniref:ISL3 family transposase n=1 Tax=Paraliobacillus ryukyuensis TaxID=200904 RepID=UPI0009A9116E|nr:ISL3 family transposase [Paraliobacillus ryukyuensis]